MEFIEWSENNLHSLGRVFLRKVIDHMRGLEESTVRFGVTGQGIMPNYQVTFPNGVIKTIRGSSHKAYDHADEFNNERISDPFNLSVIQKEYELA